MIGLIKIFCKEFGYRLEYYNREINVIVTSHLCDYELPRKHFGQKKEYIKRRTFNVFHVIEKDGYVDCSIIIANYGGRFDVNTKFVSTYNNIQYFKRLLEGLKK